MRTADCLVRNLQRVSEHFDALVGELAAATFEGSEDLARQAGPLTQLDLRQSRDHPQIGKGLFGFGNGQEVVDAFGHRSCAQAQGAHQW